MKIHVVSVLKIIVLFFFKFHVFYSLYVTRDNTTILSHYLLVFFFYNTKTVICYKFSASDVTFPFFVFSFRLKYGRRVAVPPEFYSFRRCRHRYLFVLLSLSRSFSASLPVFSMRLFEFLLLVLMMDLYYGS